METTNEAVQPKATQQHLCSLHDSYYGINDSRDRSSSCLPIYPKGFYVQTENLVSVENYRLWLHKGKCRFRVDADIQRQPIVVRGALFLLFFFRFSPKGR